MKRLIGMIAGLVIGFGCYAETIEITQEKFTEECKILGSFIEGKELTGTMAVKDINDYNVIKALLISLNNAVLAYDFDTTYEYNTCFEDYSSTMKAIGDVDNTQIDIDFYFYEDDCAYWSIDATNRYDEDIWITFDYDFETKILKIDAYTKQNEVSGAEEREFQCVIKQ